MKTDNGNETQLRNVGIASCSQNIRLGFFNIESYIKRKNHLGMRVKNWLETKSASEGITWLGSWSGRGKILGMPGITDPFFASIKNEEGEKDISESAGLSLLWAAKNSTFLCAQVRTSSCYLRVRTFWQVKSYHCIPSGESFNWVDKKMSFMHRLTSAILILSSTSVVFWSFTYKHVPTIPSRKRPKAEVPVSDLSSTYSAVRRSCTHYLRTRMSGIIDR